MDKDKSRKEKSKSNKSTDGNTSSKKSKDMPTSAIKSVKPASANKSTKPTSATKPKSQKVNSIKVKSVNAKTNKDKPKSVKSTKKGGDNINNDSGGSKKAKQPKSADKTKPKSTDSQKIKSAPASTKSQKSSGGGEPNEKVGTSKKVVNSKSQKKPQSTKKENKPKSKKEKSPPKSKKTTKKKETKGKGGGQANKPKSTDNKLETNNEEDSEASEDFYEEDEQEPSDDQGQVAEEEEEQLSGNEVDQVKPKANTLEFTKPTINQIVKEKKEVPMGTDEHISRVEFEALYDEVNDLNAGVFTLRSSYGSIIKSLVNMHTRRQKKKQQQQQSKPANEINFLTTVSEITKKQAKELESCLENADKYDIERFMNPVSREETFNALFEECAQLSAKTEKIRTVFFDAKGNFMREEYDCATEHKVDRKRFNHYRQWGKKLSTVIDEICRNYNDDLLNMFRLD